ncbi:MAG: UbiD family decarboxylase [Acidobacteria bacterium]|nr:UbiD family decarboxylase [Acidobacteriota bacterium]
MATVKSVARAKNLLPYEGLRGWMDKLAEMGDLRVVEGAGCEKDIGMATELLQHHTDAPAVLFDSIPGHKKGFRVLVNLYGTPARLALTFGLPTHLSKGELSQAILEKVTHCKPICCEFVEDGPVLENVQLGNDVDVEIFPSPRWHELDGGPYIGTGSYDITRDPDTDAVNLGTYRVMSMDKKTVGFYISPGKHGRIHREKYWSRKEACPAAIVVGGDPLLLVAACTELPYGMSEYDWVGGLRGAPYPVIRGKVTGLPIPADAEIVFEGFVPPDKKRVEGPFGEWAGYYASGAREEPFLEVKAVYYRNNPIVAGFPPQCPPDEQQRFRAIQRSALLQEELAKTSIPGVTATWCHEAGGARMLVAVAIRQLYPGHARQVGHAAATCHVGAYAGRYVIVVDEDIDVTNLEELMWAVCTRSDPATSIDIIPRMWSTPLDPRISPEDKKAGKMMNSRAIIDATRPWEWRDQFPIVNRPSAEWRRQAEQKWGWVVNRDGKKA